MKKIALFTILAFAGISILAAAVADVPDTITLKGAKKDAVQFPHKAHVDMGGTCKECHHTLEGDMDMPTQKCGDCHTDDSEVKPMKAFHGNCIDCHKAVKKEGKTAPVKCNDCHTG